jgi:type V secretory pathway adhesin AidA
VTPLRRSDRFFAVASRSTRRNVGSHAARQLNNLLGSGRIVPIARGLYRKSEWHGDEDLVEIASAAPMATITVQPSSPHSQSESADEVRNGSRWEIAAVDTAARISLLPNGSRTMPASCSTATIGASTSPYCPCAAA